MASKNKTPAKREAKTTPAPMATYRWPGDLFSEMHDRMNRMFEDFWHDYPAVSVRGLPDVGMRVDVEEKPKEFLISAELPGMDEKDIDITVSEGVLTVKGEKKTEEERDEKNVHISERTYGSFRRSFRLPAEADADKIAANFEKGVLKLTIPKAPEAETTVKKVKIKTG
jgi:HSP20 family protein